MTEPDHPTRGPVAGEGLEPAAMPAYLDVTEEWDAGGASAPQPRAASTPAAPRQAPDRAQRSAHAPVPRSGRTQIRGIARSVQTRAATDMTGGASVLSFRIDQYDASGNRLDPVGVELRSHSGGQVSDGEEVDVRGRWRHGTLRADRVINLTTGAEVRGLTRTVRRAVFALLALFVAAFLVFAVVLGISVYHSIRDNNGLGVGGQGSASSVRVPDIAGMDNVTGARQLSGAGLRFDSRNEANPTIPFGIVIRTEPAAGSTLPPDTVVTMVLSDGPQR